MTIAPLYKFFSNDSKYFKCAISKLSDGELYFSTISQLNDPWEAIAPIEDDVSSVMGNLAELNGYTGEQIVNFQKAPESVLSMTRNKTGIFCCSVKKQNSDPIRNFLLWSHYANGGKGICVEIDPLAMGSPPDSKIGVFYEEEIAYQDALSRIGFRPIYDFLLPGQGAIDPAFLNLSLYQKHECWSYESEYRYLSSTPGYVRMRKNPAKAIYFGPRVTEDTVSDVRNWLKGALGIKFYRSSIKEYGLVFSEMVG